MPKPPSRGGTEFQTNTDLEVNPRQTNFLSLSYQSKFKFFVFCSNFKAHTVFPFNIFICIPNRGVRTPQSNLQCKFTNK